MQVAGSRSATGLAREAMFGAGEGAWVAALDGMTPAEQAAYERDMAALCAGLDGGLWRALLTPAV